MTVLDGPAVDAALSGGALAWQRRDGVLVKVHRSRDFAGSMTYVGEVAALAESAGHHPDITIRWNEVTLTLWTHSVGGITERDLRLAADIDGIESPPADPVVDG